MGTFDAHKNFAVSVVATPPAPAASGTSLTVTAGEGVVFPAVPFNATIAPASGPPTAANSEVVRVTARTGDVLTITRSQEGTSARTVQLGDLVAATITAKTLTDIESSPSFIGTVNASSGGRFMGAPASGGPATEVIYVGGKGYLLGYDRNAGAYQPIGVDGSTISLSTSGNPRGTIHASGGFSWSGTTDPGAGSLVVGNAPAAGSAHVLLTPAGVIQIGMAGTSGNLAYFYTASGQAGVISASGTTTTYGTTSDQRVKRDRGRHRDPEVLRRTVVHDFDWIADGTPGRGVFAQEAALVAPFAVRVGTDEVDEQGRLKHPWGVDYAKYVPDLITGWQQHDQRCDELTARVTALELAAVPVSARGTVPKPSWLARLRTWLRWAVTYQTSS